MPKVSLKPPRIPCPIWQCDGTLEVVERPPRNAEEDNEGYAGDWQTPDLVCNNCGGVYHFSGFDRKLLEKESCQTISVINAKMLCCNLCKSFVNYRCAVTGDYKGHNSKACRGFEYK